MEECLKVYSERISSEHPPQVEECLKVSVGTLAVETKPLYGIKSVSHLFMSSQLLLYHHYDRDGVALYSNMGVALRQFVLY